MFWKKKPDLNGYLKGAYVGDVPIVESGATWFDTTPKVISTITPDRPYVAVVVTDHTECDIQSLTVKYFPVVAWENRREWVSYADGGQFETVRDHIVLVEGELLSGDELKSQLMKGECPCLIKVVPADERLEAADELQRKLRYQAIKGQDNKESSAAV